MKYKMNTYAFRRFNAPNLDLKFIDIGANLTEPMFRGIYQGREKHHNDLDKVLTRAWENGLEKIILSVGNLKEADEALFIAKEDERLFVTIGCHPVCCNDFQKDPENYYADLRRRIRMNPRKVVAIGVCGLDYTRLSYCDGEVQRTYFERQLSLAEEFRLPLFLHMRASFQNFMAMLHNSKHKLLAAGGGVIHGFMGTPAEAEAILAFGCNLYIGLNGFSLKTPENLGVVRMIPNDRIMLETDSPWSCIRPIHAGHKYVFTRFPTNKRKEKWMAGKLDYARNEPCTIRQVLEVIATVKGQQLDELAKIYYQNTINLFFKDRMES